MYSNLERGFVLLAEQALGEKWRHAHLGTRSRARASDEGACIERLGFYILLSVIDRGHSNLPTRCNSLNRGLDRRQGSKPEDCVHRDSVARELSLRSRPTNAEY